MSQLEKCDRRSLRSQRALRQALASELAESGDLSRISVASLTERAGLTRRTFYSHYRDIPDFISQIENGLLAEIRERVELITAAQLPDLYRNIDELEPAPGSVELLRYLAANRDHIGALLGPSGDPAFIKKVGMVCFYPVRKDLIDAAEAAGGNWTNDYTLHVYNGPFYISDRVLENNMTLKKNEKYWNADEVTLTQINLRVVDETSTQAQLMESQQIDVLKLTDFEYVDRWQNKVADGTFQYFGKDEPSVNYLVLNQHTEDGATGGPSGVMLNPKCRKAIALAFDREEFNAMFKEGLVTTAYGVIPYGITVGEQEFRAANPEPYADEDTSSDTIKALFEEGMAEAGVAGTVSDVTLTVISYGATTEKTSQLEWFKQQLEGNLGVKVQIDTYPDSSTFVAARNAQQYDFYLQGWNGDYNDPMTFFELWVTGNGYAKFMGGYSNPEYDEMIEKAGTSQDDAERMELFGKAEKLLLDEGGLVPLYYDNSQIYVQGYVSGLSMPMFGSDFEYSRVKILAH